MKLTHVEETAISEARREAREMGERVVVWIRRPAERHDLDDFTWTAAGPDDGPPAGNSWAKMLTTSADGDALYFAGCSFCEKRLESGSVFFPAHRAMSSCQSGRHNHCSCDCCF